MSFNNSSTVPYDTAQDRSNAQETNAEAGSGGDDLAVFSADRQTQLRQIPGGGDYSNQSSYTLPAGFADVTVLPYDTSFENGERSNTQETNAEPGPGGDVLSVWTAERQTKLRTLVGGGSFTNQSSFGIPPGFVDSSTYPYDTSFEGGERGQGNFAQGLVQDADGTPLPGKARIEEGGEVSEEKSTGGEFLISAAPPPGTTDGSDSDTPGVDFRYVPDKQALDVVREKIGRSFDLGTVQYGSLTGTVTDYNGNPVANESVTAEGGGTSTDANGNYELLAPGGQTVTLSSLLESVDKDFAVSEGAETTGGFQFSGVQVSAVLPDGTGVPNAPIKISTREGERRTDDGGEYQYVKVPPGEDITVTYLGTEERDYTASTEGSNLVKTLTLGGGCKGTIQSTRGNEIGEVDILFDIEGTPIAFSKGSGEYAIGLVDPDSVSVVCAESDRRFERADEFVDLLEGDVIEVNFTLPDAKPVGNAA